MIVKELDKTDLERFDALAKEHGSLFSSASWRSIYNGSLRLYGIYGDHGELEGGFLSYCGKKMGLSYSITPPFSPHNGLFFVNRAKNKSNHASVEKGAMHALAAHLASAGSLVVSAFDLKYRDMQPFIWKGLRVSPRYTYRIPLVAGEEELFNDLSPEKRKSIRKAQKDAVEVSLCSDHAVVKQLIAKTFVRKGQALNTALLDKILFSFANSSNSFAFVARANGEAVACTFCVHDGQTSYYLFGGYDEGNRHHGAGVTAMWESILHAKKLGLSVFDFEGSMMPEVERYFREFGGEQVPFFEVKRIAPLLRLFMRL